MKKIITSICILLPLFYIQLIGAETVGEANLKKLADRSLIVANIRNTCSLMPGRIMRIYKLEFQYAQKYMSRYDQACYKISSSATGKVATADEIYKMVHGSNIKKQNYKNRTVNKTNSNKEFITIGAAIILREKPIKNSKKIGYLRFGNIVLILKENHNSEWYKIKSLKSSQQGWVKSKFLRKITTKDKKHIVLNISKKKFQSSKSSFGNLVEIANFIQKTLEKENEHIDKKQLNLLYNEVIKQSLSIIPKNKRNEKPYLKWIEAHS